jgi:Tfp pilus assembly protein PilF
MKKRIGIYKRVLELQPSFHSARRDLAMAYVEVGDVESATNHLIEVLRLDPKDAWSWVVLANLYIREKEKACAVRNESKRNKTGIADAHGGQFISASS